MSCPRQDHGFYLITFSGKYFINIQDAGCSLAKTKVVLQYLGHLGKTVICPPTKVEGNYVAHYARPPVCLFVISPVCLSVPY